MPTTLLWSPTEFYTTKFDAADAHLRKTSTGSLAVSAGRTWTTCSIIVNPYLGWAWRPYRWSMGSFGTPRNFVVIQPDGGSALSRSGETPAVNPTIITADIG